MGKGTLSQRALQFKSEGVILESGQLICTFCGISLTNSKFLIQQHLKTKKHTEYVELKKKQQTLPGMKLENQFTKDLCQALLGSNIPLTKLKKPSLKKFLEKYTSHRVPDESTIRKNYVESAYNETIENIRAEIGECPIWASIDETTDKEGRYVANVIVGALRAECESPAHLLHSTVLEKTNNETIAQTLDEAFALLWPSRIQHDRVLLLVTDTAAYMKKAAKNLQKCLYTRMLHVTCLAHALHRVCDFVRGEFKNADALINVCKKIFLKAPYRVQKLKEMYPDLNLPPAPVITRWGTWLQATEYYGKEWNRIKTVVTALECDAESIKQAKELFEKEETFEEMTVVNQNYIFLVGCIKELECRGKELKSPIQIIKKVIQKIGETGSVAVKNKLNTVLSNNPGLAALDALVNGDITKLRTFKQFKDMTPAEISCFNYAPATSCDVERSFSRYKDILADNRRSFIFTNLRNYLIVNCNNFKDE